MFSTGRTSVNKGVSSKPPAPGMHRAASLNGKGVSFPFFHLIS